MNAETVANNDVPGTRFQVRKVTLFQPLNWLSRGWADLAGHRGASIAYGLLVTGLGWVILAFATTHVYLMAAAISGFLLVGPVMAIGLCDLSRRRECGEPAGFDRALEALRRNPAALRDFAVLLFALAAFWFLVSAVMLEAMLGRAAPGISETLWGDFLGVVTPGMVAAYIVVGGILAVAVFVLSVVSVPAILDRPISALEAMKFSARATGANIRAMLVWAALIVALTAVGFATFLIGMIVIYPLLGHATWHAYRDLSR